MRTGTLRLAPIVALVVLLSGGASGMAGDSGRVDQGLARAGAEYVPGEMLVLFRGGVSATARAGAIGALGGRLARSEGPSPATLVRLPEGASVPLAATALESDPDVVYAEPNYLYHLSGVPNDPLFSTLWGLSQASDKDIDAPEAWDLQTGSSSVVVAVVDSGIAYDHPDLAPNLWTNDDPPGGGDQDGNGFANDTHGWDFVQGDNVPLDFNGHGSHVAGTIGAKGNNAVGVTGVNWDVSLMPVRAADAAGSLTSADITNAILYACMEGADVVNGSFGGSTLGTSVANAVKSAGCAHTLFVFAAGNDHKNLDPNGAANDAFPCELHRSPAHGGVSAANVICVAATTETDTRASFSNYGATAVHLAAPGTNINSAALGFTAVGGTAEGFEGTDPEFDSRWGGRTSTSGDALWGRSSAVKRSGTYSLADSPAGNYANSSDTTIRTLGPYDLTRKAGCKIDYYLRLATEYGYDFFEIRAGPTVATTTFEGSWTGSTGGAFLALADDLSALDGLAAGYLRFGLFSNGSVNDDGAYVDDMSLKCLAPGGGRLPAAQRHLDGDAARRGRRGAPAGAEPAAHGRPAEGHPAGQRRPGRRPRRRRLHGRPAQPERGAHGRAAAGHDEADDDDHERPKRQGHLHEGEVQVQVERGGLDVQMQARLRRLDVVPLAQEVREPLEEEAHVQGACDRRGRQRRFDAGQADLEDQVDPGHREETARARSASN